MSPSDAGMLRGGAPIADASAQLRAMLESLDAAVMIFDADARLTAFNSTALERTQRNYGVALTPGARLPVRSAIDDEIAAALAGTALRVVHGPQHRPSHVTPYWVEVTLTPVRDDAGDVTGVVYHSHDITARIEAHASIVRGSAFRDALLALTSAASTASGRPNPYQHLLDSALQHVPRAQAGTVLLAEGGGTFRFVAAVGYDLRALQDHPVPASAVEFTRSVGIGACRRLRFDRFDSAAPAVALQRLLRVDTVQSSLSIPIVLGHRDLGFLQLDAFEVGAGFDAEALELGHALSGLVSALVGRVELEGLVRAERARSEHLVHHDALTGLANRALLLDRLRKALARDRRAGLTTAVIRVDLDSFKRVNEAYGHAVGDALLSRVAELLEGVVREADSVARLGSDEFAIVIAGLSDLAMVDTVARRVQSALQAPVELDGHGLEVSCSIGIAMAPGDGQDADELFGHADLALGRAKRDGPGGFAYYTAEVDRCVRERHRLGEDLRHAVRTGEGLWTAFQPKLWVNGREHVIGVEALARWDHPDMGAVAPSAFVPLGEDLGLIAALSAHIYDQACAALADWRRHGVAGDWRVALNVSPRQLAGDGLRLLLDEVLTRHELTFSDIELEVTESIAFDSDPSAIETLRQLRERGARVAIDDFGTGYASLQRLAVQPLDTLKIDRGFVSGLPQSTRDGAVVDTVVALSKGLGLDSVAEGVETDEQCQALRTRRVDVAQGYLFARPMPADEVVPWLSTRRASACRCDGDAP